MVPRSSELLEAASSASPGCRRLRRARCLVALLLALALLPAVPAAADDEPATRPPTEFERLLQAEYLDQSYVLRAPVKVQSIRSRRVVRSTVASSPSLDAVRPITVATAEGVFYLSDYARKERMPSDVHLGLGSPDTVPSDPQSDLVQASDVVEISGEPLAVIQGGELARIVGVEESPDGARVTLEGFGGQPVQAVLRSEVSIHHPAAERAAAFTASLGQLLFLLPADAAAREAWVRPEWPQAIRDAIAERRVVEGMTAEQVLLSWGTPVHITGSEPDETTVWSFQRGASIREQLRNRTRVYLSGDVVILVEQD
jgi:hypothetical protein